MTRQLRTALLGRLVAPSLVATAWLTASDAWAQGCAMCKSSLPGAEDPLTQGFNYSIFMFIGVTYALVGSIGSWIAYRYWRARSPRSESRVLAFHLTKKEEES